MFIGTYRLNLYGVSSVIGDNQQFSLFLDHPKVLERPGFERRLRYPFHDYSLWSMDWFGNTVFTR